MEIYDRLTAALSQHGLVPRGGFALTPDDALPGRSLVMVGNVGDAMWRACEAELRPVANPLDDWTERVVAPIADAFGASTVYPWSKPYRPFQQWAARAEAVAPSPLGILVHPDHGLWHAYRAALVFADAIELPARIARPSPCESCAEKPCLSACPVDAFDADGYDVDACAEFITHAPGGELCRSAGCRARAACPVGRPYGQAQLRFHMAAFYASRSAT